MASARCARGKANRRSPLRRYSLPVFLALSSCVNPSWVPSSWACLPPSEQAVETQNGEPALAPRCRKSRFMLLPSCWLPAKDPDEGAAAVRRHRQSAFEPILRRAATTTGQAATIGANRSLIWSGGCARCALDTTSCSQCHSGSELRLRVGNDLLVYHPLCFPQRGSATSAQQDHAQRDYPLRL
jgi:hypothetical protein